MSTDNKPRFIYNPDACSYCVDNHRAEPDRWCTDGLDCCGDPLWLADLGEPVEVVLPASSKGAPS